MTKNIMVLDTETIGLPLFKSYDSYYDPKESKYYDKARIIELGYIIYKDGVKIKTVSSLINLNVDINNSHIHGITKLECQEKGYNIVNVMNDFYKDLLTVDTIVAHNIMFDYNILLSELYRLNSNKIIDELNSKELLCTMKIAQKKLKLTKRPKLVELYYMLFSETIEQQHRALSDCCICGSCFFKLMSIPT